MKSILLSIPFLLLASCGWGPEGPPTVASPVAPKVSSIPKARPVDLASSQAAARAAGESSAQLKGRAAALARSNYLLSRDLDRALEFGSATKEQLAEMRVKALDQEEVIKEIGVLNDHLEEQVDILEVSLSSAQADAAALLYNRDAQSALIEDANVIIGELSAETARIQTERDAATRDLAASAAKHEEVVGTKNKWIKWTLIYAGIATLLIGLSVWAWFQTRSNPAGWVARKVVGI